MAGLPTVHETARRILIQGADPVVRLRLLRDVLRQGPDSPEVMQARNDLLQSRWMRALEREQWSDGSWGRLHSQDTSAKQAIPTTEAGVARALALGLDAAHPVLDRASRYLAGVLEGTAPYRDRPEKNDRWPTGVRLFAAATLAEIEPGHPVLDDVWHLWAAIARRTFATGAYDLQAEILAHRELTGATVKDSYLVLRSRYQLALLSARPAALPPDLEAALLHWVWQRDDGIGYLDVAVHRPPHNLKPGPLDRWLASLELLSRFASWRGLAQGAIGWLWQQRTPEGLWDLGPKAANSTALPLSESWRRQAPRQFDWTTRVLVLLQRYHTSGSPQATAQQRG